MKTGSLSVITDKDGKFVVRDLAEGVVELEITARDWPVLRPLLLTGDVVSLTVTADPPVPEGSTAPANGDRTVSGKVTVDGKPLANAPVLVGTTRVTTNAKGEYVAKGLPAGRHLVAIDDRLEPRLRRPNSQRIYADDANPMMADVRMKRSVTIDVPLRAAPMIRGRVVDAEGKPVARARVQLVIADRSALDFEFDPTASRTAPDGRYAFPASEWDDDTSAAVSVTPEHQSAVRSAPFEVGNTDHTIDITLPKTETVRIRVLDREGKPVTGARVMVAGSDELSWPGALMMLAETGPNPSITDAEGEVVTQLAHQSYDFAVAAEGFQTRQLTKEIGKPMTVDITLEREAALRGRVHRGDQGVPGVHVQVAGREARNSGITDEDGKFELSGLAPGSYRIVVLKPSAMIDRALSVDAPGEVDVALPPAGKLLGRVTDAATGEPIPDFAATIAPTEPGVSNNIDDGFSNANGTFTFDIPVGAYRVTIVAQNYAPSDPIETRVIEGQTTAIEIPLGRGATIHGRVLDDAGVPVTQAQVAVYPDPEKSRNARIIAADTQTADDGTFTATGIEPGAVWLSVQKGGFLPHRRRVQAEGTTTADVTLTRGLTIRGVVLRGGKPVEGAQVGASTAAAGSMEQTAVTDDDGRFALSGLLPMRYTVRAFYEQLNTEARAVDPAQDRDIVLSLDAKPSGVIYGLVANIPPAVGKVTRRVVMAYRDEDSVEGLIDDAGNYRIENAPAGKMMLTAVVESTGSGSRASARREVELAAGQSLRVDLDLGGSVRVSGHVTTNGKATEAEVSFSSAEGGMGSTQTREDGSYEVSLGGPGRYHIYAVSKNGEGRPYTLVRDIRRDETIDIDLSEQVFEGTVVDALTRQPVEGALVTLAPPAMASAVAEVQTGALGRFRIAAAAGGPLRIIASAAGYAQQVMTASDASTQYAFELGPAAEVRIRLLDARTGLPLDGLAVFGDDIGMLTMRPRRSSDGTTFVFSVAPGTYHVLAFVQGYPIKKVDVEAPGAIDITME